MILSTKHKFIFWHIPKNAGTSVRERLEPHGLVLDQLLGHQWITRYPYPRDWRHISQEDLKKELAVVGIQASRYREVAFVRNPYHRAVSLYNFSKYRAKSDRVGRPWGPIENLTFEEYFEKETTRMDNAWTSLKQTHWTKNPMTIGGVKVFRYEDLPNAWQDLQEHIGVELLPLEKHNVTADISEYQLMTINDLTQSQRDIVYNYYREDFETFGYER